MPGIPPAYTGVKIFKDPESKIYAYGYDKKGRKQIIYNTWFIDQQRMKRFKHVLGLKNSIDAINEHIDKVFSKKKASDKELQMCVILRLMMLCNFRIGNAKYLKDNGSYGLTTIIWSHVKFMKNKKVKIEFIGKKGVLNKSICEDAGIYRILKRMSKVKTDDTDKVFRVSSGDVNKYIKTFDNSMTAKDIRTWHANFLFVKFFQEAEEKGLSRVKSRNLAISQVAESLHNTTAVCKKNYLLPDIIAIR